MDTLREPLFEYLRETAAIWLGMPSPFPPRRPFRALVAAPVRGSCIASIAINPHQGCASGPRRSSATVLARSFAEGRAVTDLTRRFMLKATGAIGASMLSPGSGAAAPATQGLDASGSGAAPANPHAPPTTYVFLNREEAEFIEHAVARLIPADARWPGALEAGVANYIDKQLAGAWGAGERLYRSGPWRPGTPTQGYQLPFTPAELFHTALAAIEKDLASAGTPFSRMNSEQQDAYLRRLESGAKDLSGVPSDVFFDHLWQCTQEGFFSDPVYGGNRGMTAWRMVGFPGAYASYYELVDQHGIKIDRAPTSLAEDAHGHVAMKPGIPAKSP
jgi:gluconate 2-dehydrogenase gamma chain